jgi:hypothetical protein
LSAFSMLRAQFMQLMPPMFKTSFLVLVWLIGLSSLLLFIAFSDNINVSAKDISL